MPDSISREPRWRSALPASFTIPAALFVFVTVAARLWYFLDMPVPGLYGDSTTYFHLVQVMDRGDWPHFTIRTPGYPVLMKAVFSISDTVFALMVVQTVMTITGGVALIYAMHAYRRFLATWTAIGVTAFSVGLWSIENDTSMLSDSPYSSMTMIVLATTMLAVIRRSATLWALASVGMAVTIMIRPAGMFLFVIYVFWLVFLVWNRYGRRAITAMAVPLPVIVLLWATYNLNTFGSFAMTAFGESQIAFATFSFWEQDPAYPPNVNDAVARTQAVIAKYISPEERQTLHSSWDFPQLVPIFLAAIKYEALDQASTLDGTNDYLANRAWVQRVALDAVRKHPVLYVKFVLTQSYLLYVANIRYQEDFLGQVRNRIVDVYGGTKYIPGKGDSFWIDMAKEYAGPPALSGFSLSGAGAATQVMFDQSSWSRQLYVRVLKLRRDIFSRSMWSSWLFFAALLASTYRVWQTRLAHPGAFIAFIFTMSVFGANLVVALVEYGGYRYSYAIEYVYYLPTLILPFIKPIGRVPGNATTSSRHFIATKQ